MKNHPFERSSLTVWMFIIILMAVPVAVIYVMVKFTIGGPSATFIPVYGGIFLIFAYLSSSLIIQLMTRYTDSGIEQPSIFGTKFLTWQDVKEIQNITTGWMTLGGSDTKININLFLFKNPQGLLSEIRSRIPATTYPSEAEIEREIYRRKQNDAARSTIGAFIGVVLVILVGKNVFAVIFGLLMAALMLYEIRNWLKYRRLQA